MSKIKKPKLTKWEKRKIRLTKTNGWKKYRHSNKLAQRKCRAKGKAFDDSDTSSDESTHSDLEYESSTDDDEGDCTGNVSTATNHNDDLEYENDVELVVIDENDQSDSPRRSDENAAKPSTEIKCRQPGLSKYRAPSKLRK